MLYSPHVMWHEVNITFYQRTLLWTSANQKRHYLKLYNKYWYKLIDTCVDVCEFESRSGEVYSIQHYVIKFVSDLWQDSGFLRVLWFPPPIKLTATI
jgi:hypothetical protein